MKPERTSIERIRLLLLDVDGVLTDGSIFLDEDGRELKRFHVHDGSGIKYWHRAGRISAILTGRRSGAVERRALELGIPHVLQGATRKLPVYEALLGQLGLTDEQVCFVGDDLADLPVLHRVGLPVAVPDARPEVIDVAAWVTERPGGSGAVREVVERILKAQNLWEGLMERYRP
jgi:3-deoxy-D-manno-octulosonate 8-phosphate phosphatase (KDO 8-P phosphatase)